MAVWRPQSYRQRGQDLKVLQATLDHAVAVGNAVTAINPQLPPIFSLRHLAHLTEVKYGLLRAVVSRDAAEQHYTVFRIRKRPSQSGRKRYRTICVPDPSLMSVQRWIAQRVLHHGRPHAASVAYAKGDSVYAAAQPHCGCRWLIKLDIQNFFESISEIAAYRVFRNLGYQALPAFECARLATRLSVTALRKGARWRTDPSRHFTIGRYKHPVLGHLPQGAPTSPMLANLAVYDFDKAVSAIAERHGLVYTRYADDLTLSTHSRDFTRETASQAIGEICRAMGRFGFSANATKTRVSPAGGRKIVLGVLVDGPIPRLPREFKSRLRQHLYYLQHPGVGPAGHAQKRGFVAIAGLRHHVQGLISFARQIEPDYGRKCAERFAQVVWPL